MEYKARTFELPEDINGLSKAQIDVHIGLYNGYVNHVNHLHQQLTKLATADSGEDFSYSISELRRRLGFEWNGMRLHEYYFEALVGGDQTLMADSGLYQAFTKQYGGFSKWMEIFKKVNARGPGWSILYYDTQSEQFLNAWVAEHEIGQLAGLPVILALDHWEHAFMVDYKPAEKAEYIDAYLAAINWHTISNRFDNAAQ